MFTYRNYVAKLEVDAEVGILYGRILNISDTVCFEGASVKEAEENFRCAIDSYIAFCESLKREPDKPFSGKLPFRTTPDIHRDIYIAATRADKSINAWMEDILSNAAQYSQISQLGKYNINIHVREGQEIHIGDRTYVEVNQAAIGSTSLQVEISVEEYEQLVVRLQNRMDQIEAAASIYLKKNLDESDQFLQVIRPFLRDRELSELIDRVESFQERTKLLSSAKALEKEPDKPFSGKLPFRTTPEIHRDIYIAATRADKSINAWMEDILSQATRFPQNKDELSEYGGSFRQLENKLTQFEAAVSDYLNKGAFTRFLQTIKPFLRDQELPELITKVDAFNERLESVRDQVETLLEPQIERTSEESTTPFGEIDTYDIELHNQRNIFYGLQLSIPKDEVRVGELIEINISLSLEINSDDVYLLEIAEDVTSKSELNILLNTSGFQLDGSNTASLPLQDQANFSGSSQFVQTACFVLTALRPGLNMIKAEIYCGEVFETVLETTIQVLPVEGTVLNPSIVARSRPVPQPDLTLQIQTLWNDRSPLVSFQYHLDSFHPLLRFASGIQQASTPLLTESLEQTRDLLKSTLENSACGLPEDFHAQLASLGQYLFQHFLPPELQQTFRTLMRFNQTFTLLILADQDAGLPWELLHDGQQFLGERLIIGRWAWELDQTRPYEFAIGSVNVAHYANVEQPELWTSLLEVSGAPPPIPLGGGMLADLGTVEVMRGLHMLRLGLSPDAVDRQDAPVPFTGSSEGELEQELQPIKLNLRRNRPLVSLGYLNAGLPELTMLEQAWAATFIRSGCSAFVGPLWAVAPTVEAAFASSFYHRLWAGDSLGMAFQAARRTAQAVAPDSLDWMAYVLFGDPMARPYRPTQGKGYAVVEPIGQEITDPVAPGASVRFRASLRRTPPVWYDNRLMDVAEDLAFHDLQVYVIASGLQVVPADAIEMQQTPTGDYVGWFTLTVPADRLEPFALVQVHFEDEMEPIHSLRFSLIIGDREKQA